MTPETAIKYLFSTLLAALYITICPAIGAGAIDTVRLEVPQRVVVKKMPSQAGQTVLLLATNTPYEIKSEGVIGEMNISFTSSGVIRGHDFGSKSQTPLNHNQCVYLDNPRQASLFKSNFKTARAAGRPIEQAIIITITHDPAIRPKLSVHAADALQQAEVSQPCI